MHRRLVWIVSMMLLVCATSALAQGRQPQRIVVKEKRQTKLEIAGYYGYSWTFSRHVCGVRECGDIDVKSSGFWGIEVDINAAPGMQVALLYNRQDSDITFRRPIGVTETVTDVAVEYYHVGVLKGVPMGKVMPFGGGTLGATRYAYGAVRDDSGNPVNVSDDWKFSFIFMGGAKVYLSDRLGLRFQGRLPFTIWSGGLSIGCGFGGCGGGVSGYGVAQIDLSAGLMLLL
jgi:opacity protein-like surface antigen